MPSEFRLMHNSLLQTRVVLEQQHKHSNTLMGFFELLFSETEFNQQMAFWDVLTETAILTIEDKLNMDRTDPIPLIGQGMYKTIYEKIKDDPKVGSTVMRQIRSQSAGRNITTYIEEHASQDQDGYTLSQVVSQVVNLVVNGLQEETIL